MSAIAAPLVQPSARNLLEPEQRFLIDGVSWQSYVAIGEALLDRPIRMNYDRGRLELMTLSFEHEQLSALWHMLVGVMAEELDVSIKSAGSTTHQREDLERGFEPDKCYYTKSWSRVRGKRRLDFGVDPPADLALEVDITRSSVNRLGLYAALRVPEVWRYDRETIHVLVLDANGQYQPCDHSPTFPTVPLAGLVPFLEMTFTEDDGTIRRLFRSWVQSLPKAKAKPGRRPRRKRD